MNNPFDKIVSRAPEKPMLADAEIIKERLDTCKKCKFFTKSRICELCGCNMKKKINIKQATCGIKKW